MNANAKELHLPAIRYKTLRDRPNSILLMGCETTLFQILTMKPIGAYEFVSVLKTAYTPDDAPIVSKCVCGKYPCQWQGPEKMRDFPELEIVHWEDVLKGRPVSSLPETFILILSQS